MALNDRIYVLEEEQRIMRGVIDNQNAHLAELQNELNSYRIQKYKTTSPYFQLCAKQRKNIKTKVQGICQTINRELINYSVFIKEITLCDSENFDDKALIINEKLNNAEPVALEIDKVQNIKDTFLLSDRTYNVVESVLGAPVPKLKKMRNYRDEINRNLSEDFHYTNNNKSVFTPVSKQIERHLIGFLEKVEDLESIKELSVKLTSDGTNLGRTKSIINFCFTILNNTKTAKSRLGNITIGVSTVSENYDDFVEPIGYIMSEIKKLITITFRNKVIPIVYYFVADLKLLAICIGIYAANSAYPCPYCHCDKDNLHKFDSSIHNGRSKLMYDAHKNKKPHFGYKDENLLTEIPYLKLVPDTLHFRLRVFHRLIKCLISDIIVLDRYNKKEIKEEHKNLLKWVNFLNDECRINVKASYYNAKNEAGITRDFVGDELLRIFENINLPTLFPNLAFKEEKQQLFKELFYIERSISSNLISWENLKKDTKSWLETFLKYYNKSYVTPYMHIMTNHLHEFIKLYGDISLFTLQGLEKLNDQSTSELFRATNMHKDFLSQILKRRLRMFKYELEHLIE